MSAHSLLQQLFLEGAPYRPKDPGASGTLTVDRQFCLFEVTTVTGAGEARTLAQPLRAGLWCAVILKVDGGNLTLTVTGTYNGTGSTITYDDAGDGVMFYSIGIGGSCYWRVAYSWGVGLASSGTAGIFADLTADSATITAESAASILATNVSIATGLTASAAVIHGVTLGTGGAVRTAGPDVPGGAIQVSGGTAASVATVLNSPVQMVSAGTSSKNYWKLPTPAVGRCVNVVNVGGSTAGLVGAAGESIASATSVALATVDAAGGSLDLVCDGTNWWKRAK